MATFSSRFLLTALVQSGERRRPVSAHALHQRGHARTDVANHRRDDLDVRIHFLRLDVDLDEFLRRIAPGLALAVRQQPVEPRADQHHDVGVLQHGRARRTRALRVGVRQKALAHAHRQERHAALFDELADQVVALRVGRALAQNDQRLLRRLQYVERTLDRIGSGDLGRSGIDHLDQRLAALLGIHHLAEQLGRQVEIDAARTARYRRADRTRERYADIFGMQHAVSGLAERLCDRKLIHFLIVALLQVDDLTLRRARNQNHREAVGGGVRKRGQAVEKARRRYGQADARLLGEEACDRRGVAGILLVPERQHANACSLRHASEIGDRNARHAIDGVEPIQLQRVDDEIEAVRQFLIGIRLFGDRGFGHD